MDTEDSFLKLLETIQEVESPEFLFTRIHQKIESVRVNQISPRLAWGLAVSFCLLITINILILKSNEVVNHENNLIDNLHISTDNDFYK